MRKREAGRPLPEVRIPTARQIYLTSLCLCDEQQEALEQTFFSSIRLKNGTYKYTYSKRLDDLNELVNKILPSDRPLQLMDVAVSSGVSTLEWISSLNQKRIEHEMVAGDLSLTAFLISIGRHLHALVDVAGYPLQFEVNGKAIPNPPGGRNLMLYLLPLQIINTVLRLRFRSLKAICSEEGAGVYCGRLGLQCRTIALVSPRLHRPHNLTMIEDDIVSNLALHRRFHAVRASNILNRAYFDERLLETMVLNLRERLVIGGLLILCRTDEGGRNNGTVFTLKDDGSFEIKARLGHGSEIEDVVNRTSPWSDQ